MGWLKLPDDVEEMGLERCVVKPEAYLPAYEELLEHLRDEEFALLELGVFGGQSLEMWRDAFPRATVVGVDIGDCQIDLGDRVHFVRGDQRDCELLSDLRQRFAADHGFRVIIDDASHIAEPTAASLKCLFNDHLAPDGIYIIEDWGTGYIGDARWAGRELDPRSADLATLGKGLRRRRKAIRYPSHDYGMVGLVKRLVDQLAVTKSKPRPEENGQDGATHFQTLFGSSPISDLNTVEVLDMDRLTFYPGMAVLHKARAGARPN